MWLQIRVDVWYPIFGTENDVCHGAVEIFYVISGELEHVVNGWSYLLKPGMVGPTAR